MNHNFADWNTTVLFDNIKIDRTCSFNDNTLYIVVNEEGEEDIDILNDNACYSIEDYVKDNSYIDSREVIAWEDIRLYLKDKGFVITVLPYIDNFLETETQLLWEYSVLFTTPSFEIEPDMVYYHTYEECRNEAIKYCLNLIKEI